MTPSLSSWSPSGEPFRHHQYAVLSDLRGVSRPQRFEIFETRKSLEPLRSQREGAENAANFTRLIFPDRRLAKLAIWGATVYHDTRWLVTPW